ncbi:MAG: YdcF family protein [Oscillospiraceae bacterium]|nr:YdcF family protein [Oscillospiraceae bacterium]
MLLILGAVIFLLSLVTLWIFVQMAAGVFFVALGVFLPWLTKKKLLCAAVFTVIGLVLAGCVFLAAYGNADNADYTEDAVIVLGAGLRGETPSYPLRARLEKAAEYYARNPSCVIAVCGAQGANEAITEAEAMRRYLAANGVPNEAIIMETRSVTTYQNLTFADELLAERFPEGYRAVVITSAFHVFRAGRLAHGAGINAAHIGADIGLFGAPANYIRELVAVAAMIFGRKG